MKPRWILAIAAGVGVLLALGGWWLRPDPTALPKAFLTTLYTGDAARFQQMTAAMTTLPSPGGESGVSPASTEAMVPYRAIYEPLMTAPGAEALFASGDATMADQYASEKQSALTVQAVELALDTGTKELAQYRYRVELLAVDAAGIQQPLMAEGVLTVTKKAQPLIDSFKPYDRRLLR